jgi:hypothetical protein
MRTSPTTLGCGGCGGVAGTNGQGLRGVSIRIVACVQGWALCVQIVEYLLDFQFVLLDFALVVFPARYVRPPPEDPFDLVDDPEFTV